MRALVVEDEGKLAKAIAESLEASAWQVATAANGEEGFYLATSHTFDVVILDLNLPGRDGLEILLTMRRHGWRMPVLILTARDSLEDRVRGLDCGADDYLIKPFAFPELHARLRALARRGRHDDATKLRYGEIEMNRVTRIASRAGRVLDLTSKEFDLLEFLLRHKGHVVSREMLAHALWNTRARAVPLDNVIDVHIARLRSKIDAPSATPLIRTVRGVGFSIQEQDL
ncbi:MAG: response regulator transcription factor [Betaproteobacteria bacterium]|nr:response regulator transcription factor [Betaproteobacteria bacterium]